MIKTHYLSIIKYELLLVIDDFGGQHKFVGLDDCILPQWANAFHGGPLGNYLSLDFLPEIQRSDSPTTASKKITAILQTA